MGSTLAVFRALERFVSFLAALAMFLVMLIATADVVMRYLFNSPFIWSQEVIRLYLVPAIVYLTISVAYQTHSHISVDLLQYRISDRVRRVCELVTAILVAVLFAIVARGSAERAYEEWAGNDVLAGIIAWRVWPASAIVAFGSVLLSLRACGHAWAHAATLLSGRESIKLAPLAIADDAHLEGEL